MFYIRTSNHFHLIAESLYPFTSLSFLSFLSPPPDLATTCQISYLSKNKKQKKTFKNVSFNFQGSDQYFQLLHFYLPGSLNPTDPKLAALSSFEYCLTSVLSVSAKVINNVLLASPTRNLSHPSRSLLSPGPFSYSA